MPQPHEQRVIEEREALDEKLQKLSTFIETSETFRVLGRVDQHILMRQRTLMREYSVVLGLRIDRFKPDTTPQP
jgi:hypothetical protein